MQNARSVECKDNRLQVISETWYLIHSHYLAGRSFEKFASGKGYKNKERTFLTAVRKNANQKKIPKILLSCDVVMESQNIICQWRLMF